MKKLNNIFFVLNFSIITICLFFVDDFVNVTRGWFKPSIINVFLTLSLLFIISFLFFIYRKHFEKISIFYWLITLMFFVGYFAFIFYPLREFDFLEGMIIGILYTIGKYGSFLFGLFVLFNRPKKLFNTN